MRTTIWAACLLACSQAVSTSVMSHLSAAIAPTTPSALGEILAQTSQEIGKEHSCDFAQQRLRQDLPDVYDILMKGETYTDESFPFRDAFYWADQDVAGNTSQVAYHKFAWKRAYDEFPEAKLFGKDGGYITPGDIRQGNFGDCWWLGSVAALAEVPSRVETIIVNQENDPNAAGIYAFNLYALGMPITITVDDYLPVMDSEDGPKTIGAFLGDDRSLWMPLMEKAFAKLVGNYHRTEGGFGHEALSYLMNAPTISYFSYPEPSLENSVSADEIWLKVMEFDAMHGIMTAGTLINDGQGNYTAENLAKSHLYSLLGYAELSNGARLLKMRNPWGYEEYYGPYCDGCWEWTDELQEEAGMTYDWKDGVFYIPIEVFMENFSLVEFHYDTTQQYTKSSTFMRLDDELVDESQNCGEGCLEHNLTLSLDESDSPFLTLNFWDTRFYGAQYLQDDIFEIKYDLLVDGMTVAEDKYAVNYNNFKLDDLAEGEHDVMLRIRRNGSPDELPHDWSITAHGNGELNLVHSLSSLTTSTWNTLNFRDKVEQGAASSNRDTSSSVQGETRFNSWADWTFGKMSQDRVEATVQHQTLHDDYQEADSDKQIIVLTGVKEGSDTVAKVGVTMTTADWDSLRYCVNLTSSPEECEDGASGLKTCYYYLLAEEPYVAFQSEGASFDVFRVSEEFTSRDSIPSDTVAVEVDSADGVSEETD